MKRAAGEDQDRLAKRPRLLTRDLRHYVTAIRKMRLSKHCNVPCELHKLSQAALHISLSKLDFVLINCPACGHEFFHLMPTGIIVIKRHFSGRIEICSDVRERQDAADYVYLSQVCPFCREKLQSLADAHNSRQDWPYIRNQPLVAPLLAATGLLLDVCNIVGDYDGHCPNQLPHLACFECTPWLNY